METIAEYLISNNRKFIVKQKAFQSYHTTVNVHPNQVEARRIIKIICNYFGVQFSDINDRNRLRNKVIIRQYIMVFVLQKTNLTLKEVGQLFNRKTGKGYDHSTVSHAKKTIKDLIQTNKDIRAEYERIAELL